MVVTTKPDLSPMRGRDSATKSGCTPGSTGQRKAPRERAERLLATEIPFIASEEFLDRSAERSIMDTPIALDAAPERIEPGTSRLPSHLAHLCDSPLLEGEEESVLFRRMNYLRFKANSLRCRLNPSRPNVRQMDQIEMLLGEADRIRHRIASANVRLVVSLVKQLVGVAPEFDEMLSDGLLAMLRAVEKFDYERGFRFSTYATMVIRRQLYRSMKNGHRDRTRFPIGDPLLMIEHPEEQREARLGFQGWQQLHRSLTTMMIDLDDREREIIRARFGLDTDGKKQTLQSLAADLGVCKERVRQLEKRAMKKLRAMAESCGLESLLDPDCCF